MLKTTDMKKIIATFYLVRLVEKQAEICEDDPQFLPARPALEFAKQIATQKTLCNDSSHKMPHFSSVHGST